MACLPFPRAANRRADAEAAEEVLGAVQESVGAAASATSPRSVQVRRRCCGWWLGEQRRAVRAVPLFRGSRFESDVDSNPCSWRVSLFGLKCVCD